MGECMLERYGEDGFQSCEGFDDWSTFSSADWTDTQQNDNGFSDWSGFQDNTRKEEFAVVPATETGTFEFPENVENGDEANPWFVFNDCFQVEEAEKDVVVEIPTLSQLQECTLDSSPPSGGISREAANFWCHLQYGSKLLRLSGSKPKLHSHEGLLKTLALRQPDASTDSQEATVFDQDDPPGALIQTKLIPSSHCRNAPGFLYQISRQWLNMNQHNKLALQ